MPFQDALEAIMDGKKIKRAIWGDKVHVIWHVGAGGFECLRYVVDAHKTKDFTQIALNWVTAVDWEVVD